MRALELLVQNQFITPSTILNLVNCVVIPVWTYLCHSWADPITFRTSHLWFKTLSKPSNCKHKHELTKIEYIFSHFPIDLAIQFSETKFDHKNGFDSDQCSRAQSDSHQSIKDTSIQRPRFRKIFRYRSGCKNHKTNLWTVYSNYGNADWEMFRQNSPR